jgi:hypothetical protein
MAISLQPTRRKSSRGLELLENNENLLLSEEFHFVETYCQILEINIEEKVVLIVATEVDGRCCYITVDSVTSASQNGASFYGVFLNRTLR